MAENVGNTQYFRSKVEPEFHVKEVLDLVYMQWMRRVIIL